VDRYHYDTLKGLKRGGAGAGAKTCRWNWCREYWGGGSGRVVVLRNEGENTVFR
jgi:hypothetical protein